MKRSGRQKKSKSTRRSRDSVEAKPSPPAKQSRKAGRPSEYNEAITDEICFRISHGETLNQILKDDHMPSRPAVMRWLLAPEHEGFRSKYERARAALLEHWAEEIIDISDEGKNDWMTRETNAGRIQKSVDNEVVNRSRLRVDTRKWLLSKLNPERYGERLDLSNKDGTLASSFAVAMGTAMKYPIPGKTNGNGAAHPKSSE